MRFADSQTAQWSRREFLGSASALAGGALLSGLSAACSPGGPQSPLNLILIVVEDWNAEILGCYGNPAVKTPRVDAFAAGALRFTRAYCQSPVCNASRSSFLTGLRPESTRVFDNDDPMDVLVPADALSLPELWTRAGGRAWNIGKLFHTARHAGAQLRAFERIELGQRPEGYAGAQSDFHAGGALRRRRNEQGRDRAGPGQRRRSMRFGDSGRSEEEEPDGIRARLAAEWLGELAQSAAPFLLSIGFSRPHVPLLAPRAYLDLYDPAALSLPRPAREELRGVPDVALRWRRNYEVFPDGDPTPEQARTALTAYYACVSFIDAQIGLVLDALEATGLADRSAVAIVSDHGFHLGDRGLWSKLTLFEAATRVPLLLRVPGSTPQGRSCEALVELVDLLPSLAELCGFPAPAAPEGTSFAPLLRAPERDWKSAAFSLCARGQHEWIGRSLRTSRHRYTEWRRGEEVVRELYELASDPYESVNRAADPALESTRLDLEERLRAGWRAALPRIT